MIKFRKVFISLILIVQFVILGNTAKASDATDTPLNLGVTEISEILCSNISEKSTCLKQVGLEVEKYFSTKVQIIGVVSSIKNQIDSIPDWESVPVLPSEPVMNWEKYRGTGMEGISTAKSELVQYVQNILKVGDKITLKLESELKNKSITCIKGKIIKKTKNKNCPKGYKKR